jgi:lysophospholipase L1-like esterase
VFHVDRDVTLDKDAQTLTFREAGPIVPFRPADLYPPVDTPSSYKHRVGHPEQGLFYAPGRGFLDRDVEISYVRRGNWTGPSVQVADQSLPRTIQLLRDGKPIRIGVSGDSISFGWDSSRMSDAPPFQFAYPSLVAAQITESTGCEVDLVNRAISGWSVSHGVEDLPNLLATNPDLVIVAYGMNDVGRRDPAWFGNQTKLIVEQIKKEKPTTEIILVSPMMGNREWIHTPREMFTHYRDELAKLVGEGVALADVTGVWQTFLEHKHDLDLTGNGLNHPNDFGHRLYAQTILGLLLSAQP